MGGYFVNYFNRFGRQWQVYVEAEGEYRTRAENIGLFYVRNNRGQSVPLSAVHEHRASHRPGVHHALQRISLRANQRQRRARLQFRPGHQAPWRRSSRKTMPPRNGLRLFRHVLPGTKGRRKAFHPSLIFGLSLVFVFLILAAQYESWSLPFSVLLGTPIAVFGAFLAL